MAVGRADWIGWVELTTEPVDELAIRMTARVIDDVGADVLAVAEAEDRPSLVRFNDEMLDGRYAHVMLIDGNDQRGIDVGLFTTGAVEMLSVTTHVDDPDPKRPGKGLFSRDCPVHRLRVGGTELLVLVNHLKSQSFTSGDPDPLRTRQSERVRAIYDQLRADGAELVAIVGDLNKGPTTDSPPRHPTWRPCWGRAVLWWTPMGSPSSTRVLARAPSRPAAPVSAWTTSLSPPSSPPGSRPAASTARACGATQRTRTPPPRGRCSRP